MLLLLCSIVLVLASSFFLANCVDFKNIVNNIISFWLIAFANVVLTFEILSLFSAISQTNILYVNLAFAILSTIFWVCKKCPVIHVDWKSCFKNILTAVKLDKTLAFLLAGFVFTCIVSLILIALIPGVDIDSSTYRVVRALFWVDYGNLNHFQAADARILMFPINSEILYAWFITFLKSDRFLFIFNFCGVILYLTALYGFMSEITTSIRKKLWVVLIAASVPFVLVRFTGLDTGVIVAAIVLSSIYLYLQYLKTRNILLCIMSALALALGIGTKTTVILMLPALVLWFVWYTYYTDKSNIIKHFVRFVLFFFLTFIVFSSYNYILNFINYGNFISAVNVAKAHANTDGLISVFPNLYRYIFDFFAFPEYPWSAILSSKILLLREGLLQFLNADTGYGDTVATYNVVFYSVSTASSSVGFFGPLLFIPVYIFTLCKGLKSRNRKNLLMFSLLCVYGITVVVMSACLAFMSFNIRFLSTFVLLTLPLIAYFYNKKYGFYKLFISAIALVYLFTIPENISLYPINGIINSFKQGADIERLGTITKCSFFREGLDVNNYKVRDLACLVSKKIMDYSPDNKILYFPSGDESIAPIKELMFKGYHIDTGLASELDKINFDDYNIILTCDDKQTNRTFFSDKNLDENGYYYKNGVFCSYLNRDFKYIKNFSKEKNFLSHEECVFQKNFADEHDLQLDFWIRYNVGMDADGKPVKQTFRFYENKNNPIIK